MDLKSGITSKTKLLQQNWTHLQNLCIKVDQMAYAKVLEIFMRQEGRNFDMWFIWCRVSQKNLGQYEYTGPIKRKQFSWDTLLLLFLLWLLLRFCEYAGPKTVKNIFKVCWIYGSQWFCDYAGPNTYVSIFRLGPIY